MLKTGIPALLTATLLAAGATAPRTLAQTTPQPPPAARQAEAPPLPVNIRLDLKITEQAGSGAPVSKQLSLMVSDRGHGSVRSTGMVRSHGRVQIQMDARPQILPNGDIRLTMGLEYSPRVLEPDAAATWSALNQQINVVLQPGTPMIISQSADPASERRVTVEVSATTATPRP